VSSDNRLTTELRRQARRDAFRMKNITVFMIVITALMSAPRIRRTSAGFG
jgi:hypothetical protein